MESIEEEHSQSCMGRRVGHRSSTEHYGYANSQGCASATAPPIFRLSLVREAVFEIRNLVWRMLEIRRRSLDRTGILIHPLHEIVSRQEQRESALEGCIRDMHNLCKHRPPLGLIEAELFVRAWESGAAYMQCMSSTQSRGEASESPMRSVFQKLEPEQ